MTTLEYFADAAERGIVPIFFVEGNTQFTGGPPAASEESLQMAYSSDRNDRAAAAVFAVMAARMLIGCPAV
jgi:hypothetical protein